MEKDDSEELKRFFDLKNLPSVFGPESFITRIKEEFYFKKRSSEVPNSNKMAPEPVTIINEICHYYQVPSDEILKTRRGWWFNKPRNIAIYLIRLLRTEKLTAISDMFNMQSYSAVSSVIQRVGALRKKDKNIRKDIDIIIKNISKGQLKI